MAPRNHEADTVGHKIEELPLQNDIVSFAFRDCDQGWRCEVERPDPKINPNADKYHGSKILIKETRDGGQTWAQVHVGDTLLRGLKYQKSNGRLWAIRVDYDPAKRGRKMTHSLVVSDDGGQHWREYCALPHGPESFEFIDERRGYAWTAASLHATADGGEHWRKLSELEGVPFDARSEFVGTDGAFHFIRSGQVFGINPWQGIEWPILLPEGFEPRRLSVAKADNRLFILGQARKQWKLILVEGHEMISMNDVPLDPEWRPRVFLHDNGILNLVCNSNLSPLGTRYHFLAMDEQGWDIQSLSGKTRFGQFGFAGTCAWATRFSFLRWVDEVWRRTAAGAVTENGRGDCWASMDNPDSQAPAS